jgi:DNA-directed RNA polymerase subunit omega
VNSEYCKQALEKVLNPNILVNLVSRRVRQLTSGGSNSRPLVVTTAGMGAADIALLEIIEEKIGWEMLESAEEEMPAPPKRARS